MIKSFLKGIGIGFGVYLSQKIYDFICTDHHRFFYGNFETMEAAGNALTDMHFKFEEQGYLTVSQFYELCHLKDLGNRWDYTRKAWDSLVGFKVTKSRYDGRWGIVAPNPKVIFT